MAVSTDILSCESLENAGNLEILDEKGEKHKFSSLHAERQTLVIFIRHFFCGSCKEYVTVLSKEISPSELAANNIDIAIIGCGDPSLIASYAADTGSHYPIYSDPSQRLYKALGLTKTLAFGKKPDYVSSGVLTVVKTSIQDVLKIGISNAFKGGDVRQVGGDFLLGPGNKCTWGHKMTTTRDHTEIVDLRKVLNLQAKETNTTYPAEAQIHTAESVAA